MDNSHTEDIPREIEHLPPKEAVDALYQRIEAESQKPDDQINLQLIDDCTTLVNRYISDDPQNVSEEEINQIYLQHQKRKKARRGMRTHANRTVAKRILIAAAIILLLCCTTFTTGAAFEGVSVSEYLSYILQNLKPGERIDKDGSTWEYVGENKQYADIKDVLAEQNLDILYPSTLPKGLAIKKVYLIEPFSEEGKGELVITFNNKEISCVISKQPRVNINPDEYEKHTTDHAVFYIDTITPDACYQATAHSDGIEYTVVCNDYDLLIAFIDGFSKGTP